MKLVKSLLLVVCLSFFGSGTVHAVTETFDSYPTHTNTTNSGDTEVDTFAIYGDWATNNQIIGAWEGDVGDPGDGVTSAGIVNDGSNSYAFGTGSDTNPTPGFLAIMDFGMHDWGLTSGVIADYLGVGGLDLHGGTLDVRALLDSNFSGQMRLGFVSDSEFDYGDGLEWVEFLGPMFTLTDSFTGYHGELNNFLSDANGTSYGASSEAKILGVWVELHNLNTTGGTISGELQIDEIVLVPEPTSLVILTVSCAVLLKQRTKRRRQS